MRFIDKMAKVIDKMAKSFGRLKNLSYICGVKKIFSYLIPVAGILFITQSCAEADTESGYGKIAMDVHAENTVNVVRTRALETLPGLVAPGEEDFTLAIKGPKTDREWASITDFPQDTVLTAGSYTATALYGDPEAEGFDCPAFGATQTFKINHLATTTVDLTAKLMNMAVTVDYTEAFESYFATYTATIIREDEDIVSIDKGDARPLFLRPEAFTLRVDYTMRPNGATDEVTGEPIVRTGTKTYKVSENIGAARWLRVEIDAPNAGGADITVTFDGMEAHDLGTIDVGETE